MNLTFLKSNINLTKKFERLPDGSLEKFPYPHVKNFSSDSESAANITEFYEALKRHADQGHCLLKGNVQAPLVNQSRSGSTNALTPTRFVVFDLDGLNNITAAEQFIRGVLPLPFQGVSHVIQSSASSGISGDGLRAHVFFMLENEVTPSVIKTWLTELNLSHPMLSGQLRLSANGLSLVYPLDITVCQNDKLIYIAPPECVGFDDPLKGERIKLVKESREAVLFDFAAQPPAALATKVTDKVNELRAAIGLKAKTMKFSNFDGLQVLANPEPGSVIGEKLVNGFIRINLQGQNDSWGHYYDPEKPRFLYNFKGEPVVEIQAFLPDYWAQVVMPRLDKLKAAGGRERPLTFRDKKSDVYYAGIVSEEGTLSELNQIGSKDKIDDFFANLGEAPPDPIPDWDLVFDPTTDAIVDWDKQRCNRWQPTEFIAAAVKGQSEIPKVIDMILHHVLAHDPESYDRFLNWLAYIYQNRTKTGVAWVIHGIPGTGKGLLFDNVISPLFGRDFCPTRSLAELDDKFNNYMESALFVNVDETRVSDHGPKASKLINQIKALITAPRVTIRGMRENYREVRSFTNFIFTSNEVDAMSIMDNDRRFSVAPRQEEKIQITNDQVESIPSELYKFAGFLQEFKVNKEMAHTAMENEAKLLMRKAAQNSVDEFAEAFIDGDLDYFVDGLESDSFDAPMAAAEYRKAVERWVMDYRHGRSSVVGAKEAHAAYLTLFDGRDMKLKKFTRMMKHKNLLFRTRVMVDGDRRLGFPVEWKVDPEVAANWNLSPTLRVVGGTKPDVVSNM